MAKPIEKLSIELKFTDAGSQAVIDKVRGSLKRLQLGASGAIPSVNRLRDEILAQGRASVSSVSNINAQRTALMALRDEARIGGHTFKQLTEDVKKLDAQLAKTQGRKPGGGGRALAATQIAGAVVSGGIFGGPEGALGALGGAALGGVPGAFAGAAIGAQVGGVRQTLGEFADYAAQIGRLEIALEGIAGSQGEFNKALRAARDVTETLNVPQEVAIQGITRLTAAVKGAGGTVTDAELAFKNINSAIIATGGGSEQVQGAVTALVQIFSKGKVSAEEINQIAERLPGTFNKIAEASGRTGPELTKALQDGQVGLNDLTKFLVALGDEYGDIASTVASSSENAGARLQVAFNDLRIDVGEALQPIGAEFQNAFTEFLKNITPALVEVLPKIAALSLDLAKNLDVLAAAALAAGTAMGVIAVQAAIIKAGSIAALFNKIAVAATAAGVATKGMSAAILLNPYVALAAGVTAATAGIIKYYKHQEELNGILDEGKASTSVLKDKIQEYRDSITKLTTKLTGANGEQKATGREANRLKKEIRELRGELERVEGTYKIRIEYEDKGYKFDEKGNLKEFTVAGNVYDAKTRQFLRKQTPDLTDFAGPKPDDDAAGSGSQAIISDRQVELAQRLAQAEGEVAADVQATLKYMLARQKILDKNLEGNEEQVRLAEALRRFRADITNISRREATAAERQADAEATKNDRIEQARVLAGEITQEEYDRVKTLKEMKVLLEDKPELYEKIKKKLEEAATPLGKFKAGVRKIFEEAMNLNQALAERGVQAVQQFGDAFADFVATGKANFADLTRSILQDLSRIFARAALFKGLSLIPGVGSFLSLPGFADGGVIAKNKIVPFAYGGIVNKPTLFPMANGAGLMGEAGPEAIMPLRRGRDGKLGVEASGGVGNVVVNVDASGSRVQGDQPNAKALGSAIGAAVQAEIVRQKRPGGLLS